VTGRILITGTGMVTSQGLGLAPLAAAIQGEGVPFTEEEPRPGTVVRVGRVGRVKCKEASEAYRRWGQLDTYSRYGFLGAFQALRDAGIAMGDPALTDFGVMMGTSFGCMEENQKFDRFEIRDGKVYGASPLVFKGTVDNAPAGWIAVAWRIKGPNATFVSGDGAALEALWSAEGVLRSGRARGLLVGGVERFVDLHLLLHRADPARSGAPLSEGAGVILIETEASLLDRGRTTSDALAELVGTTRRRGTLTDALLAAIERLGIDPLELGLVSLALPSLDERASAVYEAVPGVEIVADQEILGEFHGAWGGVAVGAALARRTSSGWNGRPHALVHAFGEGDEHFFALLKSPPTGSEHPEEA
jgi:3-oxoacyl-[acyl-carrier-protein] synthase II